MAVEIVILCLRPLPAMGGGWSSAKWRTPKLAASVEVRPQAAVELIGALSANARAELGDLALAPFVAGLRMVGPATTFEVATSYAQVVAEACAAVVLVGEELTSDHRASTEVWSGSEIEQRWRAIDAEAARAEPGYQPVRGPNDDHRPTQTFAFPLRIDDGVVSLPSRLDPHRAPTANPRDAEDTARGERAFAQGTRTRTSQGVGTASLPRTSVAAAPHPIEPAPHENDWSDVMPK